MQFNGKSITAFGNFTGAGGVGVETPEGGTIFNDLKTNKAPAKFATAFGSESAAVAEGAIAAGFKIPRSDAEITYDEDGEQVATNPDDWRYNEAYGKGSEAFGRGAVAYSRASKSFGYRTQTGYPPSHMIAALRPEAIVQTDADGNPTFPGDNVGQGAVALGADTAALENHSLAGGWCSIARGASSFAFGDHVETIGYGAVSFGRNNKAHSSYSVAFGDGCEASGVNSFAGGNLSRANGSNAFAMGFTCVANGDGSVALGSKNTSGVAGDTKVKFAVTAGRECEASATCAVALGYGSVANAYGQTVVGRFNQIDAGALFAVGSGTADNARSTAFKVDTKGNVTVAGSLVANGATFHNSALFNDSVTFLSGVECFGKMTFSSTDDATRKAIMAARDVGRAPTKSDKGQYPGQLWRVLDDSNAITAVYLYAGIDGSGSLWYKLG